MLQMFDLRYLSLFILHPNIFILALVNNSSVAGVVMIVECKFSLTGCLDERQCVDSWYAVQDNLGSYSYLTFRTFV
jgi:hypothetical protein